VRVLLAASEMTPYAKTGGLGDVVGALSLELADLGHEVICCLPYYRCVRNVVTTAKPLGLALQIPLGSKLANGDVLETLHAGRVRVLFIRRDEYYDRSELYHTGGRDYDDNAERFLFFSKAVVELAGDNRLEPDIVHCHDWQTAFMPVQAAYRRSALGAGFGAKTVFTIHNLAYQGMYPASVFALTNLPGEFFTPAALEFYGQMNLMKGGIIFSDAITTVSKRYAQEILTPEGGFGLDAVLRTRSADLHGILNGADYRIWDPATDPVLKAHYSLDDPSGKRLCRAQLLRETGLEVENSMAIAAVISRLTGLKGVDLIAGGVEKLLGLGVALVVLGKGEQKHEDLFVDLAKRFPKRIFCRIGHDEALAHKIQAGADVLLMPSKFEPCGLTQMYALKYGTVPVVRATGGLDDTISQYDRKTGKGNGFKFTEYSSEALVKALREAMSLFHRPQEWQKLVRNAMACDFSWRRSATEYAKLYAAL
jgi:starch synthase